jgi:anti-anti-sigma factor
LLSGALDQYHADELKQQLLSALASSGEKRAELLLDMTGVEHIDASGLQVLLACQAELERSTPARDKLIVRGADASVQQWIHIAGADGRFTFLDQTV